MSCLRVIGQFVSEFARFILFFASIIFLLSSSILLLFSFQSRKDFSYVQLENINTVLSIIVGLSIYLIVLAIIGVFASFFSSKSTIKLLAFMTTLNVIVGIAVLASSSPKLDSVHQDLVGKLREFQSKYDWEHRRSNSTDLTVKNATLAWDKIQQDLHCCGLEGPADWAQLRPKGHEGEDILPISCCQDYAREHEPGSTPTPEGAEPVFCQTKKQDVWTKGCSGEMESTFELIMEMVIFVVSFSLVVGVLSAIVLCCRPSEERFSTNLAYR